MQTLDQWMTNFYDSTSRTLEFTGLQLEVGDTATDFEHRSFGDELAEVSVLLRAHKLVLHMLGQLLGGYSNTTLML